MPSIRTAFKNGTLSLFALLLSISSIVPVIAAADDCTPPDSSQAGVHVPVGSDAATYTYQCAGQYAGEWTNAHYVYNPATATASPLYSPDYQYDCTSGTWTAAEWDYAPAQGTYYYNRPTVSAPSGVATNCPTPAAQAAAANNNAGSTDGAGNGIDNTGPGSNNGTNLNGTNNVNGNNSTTLSLNNQVNGVSLTGAANVSGNTIGGAATTGNAQDISNVINMLQSTSNALGSGNLVTFVDNIDGDVNGDLLLSPATLASIQGSGPNSNNSNNTNLDNNLTLNNSVNADINNDVDLSAKSGDANVSGNNTGGDATSGSAHTIANVINTINSAVTSGKSFLGVVNINGNLNGDILLPADFVDQLLAANVPTVTLTGPSSNNSNNTTVNNNGTVTNTNNLGITNNVDAKANSGAANVGGNTIGGSATSGSAKTSVTAFNLTGSSVVGANDMLVFVNVAGGKWVGLIVNAPAGATAAELGGGITSTGPNSNNSNNTTENNNATVNNTANHKITNNIKTTADSGNANVTGNTRGGNAISGDADGAVNLLNVENSNLNLSGWFGVLFINVFGTWNGSFGMNTSAGDPIATAGSSFANADGSVFTPTQLVSFVQNHNSSGSNFDFSPFATAAANAENNTSSVLAATNVANGTKATPQLQAAHGSFGRLAGIIGSLVVLYILADAVYTHRRQVAKAKARV